MAQIQYEHWKTYLPYIIAAALLLFFIPGLIKTALGGNVLASEVKGELVVKENGVVISRLPFLSCGGSLFGVELSTKDKEGVFFAPSTLQSKDSNFPLEIDYHQPPTGGRWYGRPCQFTKADVTAGYPSSASFLINLFTRRFGRDRGNDYWSGTLQASCTIE